MERLTPESSIDVGNISRLRLRPTDGPMALRSVRPQSEAITTIATRSLPEYFHRHALEAASYVSQGIVWIDGDERPHIISRMDPRHVQHAVMYMERRATAMRAYHREQWRGRIDAWREVFAGQAPAEWPPPDTTPEEDLDFIRGTRLYNEMLQRLADCGMMVPTDDEETK